MRIAGPRIAWFSRCSRGALIQRLTDGVSVGEMAGRCGHWRNPRRIDPPDLASLGRQSSSLYRRPFVDPPVKFLVLGLRRRALLLRGCRFAIRRLGGGAFECLFESAGGVGAGALSSSRITDHRQKAVRVTAGNLCGAFAYLKFTLAGCFGPDAHVIPGAGGLVTAVGAFPSIRRWTHI